MIQLLDDCYFSKVKFHPPKFPFLLIVILMDKNELKGNYYSLNDISSEIKCGNAAIVIEELEEKIQKIEDDKRKSVLCCNLALCYLHLEAVRKAFLMCIESINLNPNQGLAYFIEGVAYLWTDNEEKAIETWSDGIPSIFDFHLTETLKNLVFDHNFREFIYKHKFDVLTIISIFKDYNNENQHCESDLETAFSELKKNSLFPALTYFSLILKKDPNNYEALLGRGIVYCLLTQWHKCIEDLDRDFPPEMQNDALKFCSIAMASTGNLFMGVSKISQAILNSPIDFEAIAERAKMQMMRGCYTLALQDFRSVPEQCYTDRIWLYIAECLYSIGDIPRATEAIARAEKENDHRKGYCYFLILRDRGLKEASKKQIIETTQLMPSFFLLRIAGDFMMDIGEYHNAAHYYEAALQQKGEDAETKRLYGLALFHSLSPLKAQSVLQELQSGWCTFSSSADTCPRSISGFCIDGPLLNFNKSINTKQVLESATLDYIWVSKLIRLWNKSALGASRDVTNIGDSINEITKEQIKINPTEKPENTNEKEGKDNSQTNENAGNEIEYDESTYQEELDMTPQLMALIEDADRIGERCFPKAPEVVDNPKVIRALGFCVLYLAQYLKMIWLGSGEQDWKEALDPLRIILSFADMRCNVQWRISDNSNNAQTPIYILQKGEWRSPRFSFTIQYAIQQIRYYLCQRQITDLCQLTTLDNLYGVSQGDLAFPSTSVEQLPSPTISLRSLGSHGYQLAITPPVDASVINSYCDCIQKKWEKILQPEKCENYNDLSLIVLLIWNLQPFTHYNNELGHIILHAYVLAKEGKEISRLRDPQGELFIKQMVVPSPSQFQKIVSEHICDPLEKKYDDNSLTFWNKVPNVGNLMKLLSYQTEKAETETLLKPPTVNDNEL